MRRRTALRFLLALVPVLGLGLLSGLTLPTLPFPGPVQGAHPSPVKAERVVYLGGRLADEQVIAFTAAVAAARPDAVVLLDSPSTASPIKAFLADYRPERIVPVGSFPEGVLEVEARLIPRTSPTLPWKRGPPLALWKELFPWAERVVVCPAQPRGQLLEAACLAGSLRAPLYITHRGMGEDQELRGLLAGWRTREVFAVGSAVLLCRGLPDVRLVPLRDAQAVADAYLSRQLKSEPIRTLVVTNPSDTRQDLGGMSVLAPWVALHHHAALLLTNDQGNNTTAVVHQADALEADNLILVANLKAIPMERRDNPQPGKDEAIEMEPLTPTGVGAFSYATGRLFHQDPAVVPLLLARQRLLEEASARVLPPHSRKALVVSNSGG
ncbi:MAG: hypothetical protein JO112_13085, partial [Planctomycetes bacterium]|nr:hypothetical protein [Planctomycetota bacterium]